ncbi:PQQ-binding-like beta-propeller repeat protein [Streptomyces fuscichromogenes]|uniref:serine/threonine-protein kinase n=1 Tax=Streptomyces fuscichromogenes TaxID=1324013 RepID=UPI0038118453
MNPLRPEDPERLGPYRLVARLGAGGMGRVYLAVSAAGRTVAVKVIRPEMAEDKSFRIRFRREVAAAAAVGGVYTAPVLDAAPDAETPWLATAYIPGPTLAEAIAEHGPLPADTVLALGAGIAEALIAVHAEGLVHRDLKPSNVLLAADGPRVIDFGIVRARDGYELTGAGGLFGSLEYMCPEQATGESMGPEGDVFCLGSVLTFAASGRAPFSGAAAAALLYNMVHGSPDLSQVPEPLDKIISLCLAKDPALRISPDRLSAACAPGGAELVLTEGWLPDPVAMLIARHRAAAADLGLLARTPAAAEPWTDDLDVAFPAARAHGSVYATVGRPAYDDAAEAREAEACPYSGGPGADGRAGGGSAGSAADDDCPATGGDQGDGGPPRGAALTTEAPDQEDFSVPEEPVPDRYATRVDVHTYEDGRTRRDGVGRLSEGPGRPPWGAGRRAAGAGRAPGALGRPPGTTPAAGTSGAPAHRRATPSSAVSRRVVLSAALGTAVAVGGVALAATRSAGGGQGARRLVPAPDPSWTYRSDPLIQAPAVFSNGAALIKSRPGNMVALDVAGGAQPKWVYQGISLSPTPVMLTYGAAIALGTGSTLIGVDPADGRERFTLDFGDEYRFDQLLGSYDGYAVSVLGARLQRQSSEQGVATSTSTVFGVDLRIRQAVVIPIDPEDVGIDLKPVVTAGYFVYADGLRNVAVRNSRDGGSLIWRHPVGYDLRPGLAVLGDTVFAIGSELIALDLGTGKLRWRAKAESGLFASLGVRGNTVYATGTEPSGVYAFNAVNGTRRWFCETPSLNVDDPIAVGEGAVYVPALENRKGFYAVDAAAGRLLWNFTDGRETGVNNWQLSCDGAGHLVAQHFDRVYGIPAV